MRPGPRRTTPVALVGLVGPVLVALSAVAGCGGGTVAAPDAPANGSADTSGRWTEVASVEARAAAGLAELEDDLLVGELGSGRIVRWSPTTGAVSDVATVPVATGGQRGLLGLGVGPDGAVLLSRTRPDGRLVVERLDPDGPQPVWEGPASTDRATGGRFVVTPDGEIVVGVGDLLDPAAVDDPEAPNGKLLRVTPDGVDVVAGGWNNPFAFDAGSDGTIWVADNAPGSEAPERLARVDPSGEVRVVSETTPQRAPSGLAVLDGDALAVCGFLTGELVVGDTVVADDCAYGVVGLSDGRLAYAAADRVVVLAPADG